MSQTVELLSTLTQPPSFQIERVRRRAKDEVERVLNKHGSSMRG